MASQLQLRGGTTAQHATFIGAEREITVDTDKNTLVVHDGVTQGGFLIKDKNQVASSTNVNPDSVSIANNTLNLANSYFNYTAGITDKGYTLTSRDVTKSVDLSGVSDGLKWVSENSDGTNSFYDVKPSYGLYTKTSADDNRPVFIDGKWYSTVGGELVTNGTFDTDTSGWNTQLYGVDGSGNISFTLDNNVISVSNNIYDGSTVYTEIQTEIGKEYYITTDTITGINRASYLGVSSSLVWPDSTFASQTSINIGGSILERLEFKFIAKSTTSYIHLRVNSSASDTVYFDNISVYAVEPTLGTEILPTPSFIKNPVYIDNQIPQYIDYSQELATNVIDSTVIDGSLTTKDVTLTDRPLFIGYAGGTNIESAGVIFDWTVEVDTHNAYSNGLWTCPKEGWYKFNPRVWNVHATTSGLTVNSSMYINGRLEAAFYTNGTSSQTYVGVAPTIMKYLKVGDTMYIESMQASTSHYVYFGGGKSHTNITITYEGK